MPQPHPFFARIRYEQELEKQRNRNKDFFQRILPELDAKSVYKFQTDVSLSKPQTVSSLNQVENENKVEVPVTEQSKPIATTTNIVLPPQISSNVIHTQQPELALQVIPTVSSEMKPQPPLEIQAPSTTKSLNFLKGFNFPFPNIRLQPKPKPQPQPKPLPENPPASAPAPAPAPPNLYQVLKNSYAPTKAEELSGYRYDTELSNDNQQVYFNPNTSTENQLLMTVTGTHNVADIGTDIFLGLGKLKDTRRYQEADQTLQQAKQKYNTNQAIVAGHSLGGTIASNIANTQVDKIFTLDKGATFGQPVQQGEQAFRTRGDIISTLNSRDSNMQTLANPNTKSNWVYDPWKAHAVNNIVDTPIALIPAQSLELQVIPTQSVEQPVMELNTPLQIVPRSEYQFPTILEKRKRKQKDIFEQDKQFRLNPESDIEVAPAIPVPDLFEPSLTYKKRPVTDWKAMFIREKNSSYTQQLPLSVNRVKGFKYPRNLTRPKVIQKQEELPTFKSFKWNFSTDEPVLTDFGLRLVELKQAQLRKDKSRYYSKKLIEREVEVPAVQVVKKRQLQDETSSKPNKSLKSTFLEFGEE